MDDHPLYSAVLGDDLHEVRAGISAWPAGVPLDPRLLELAFVDPRPEIVCELIEVGMNPNGDDPDDPGWPLRWAASTGSMELVECLLKAGADSNLLAADLDGALNVARGKGHTQIVERLLKAGAKEPVQFFTDLRTAVLWNKTGEVRRLLPAHLPKEDADELLNLSLRSHCSPEMAELLIDRGADPNAHISDLHDPTGSFDTAPPLYLAVFRRCASCFGVLLAQGANARALGGALMLEAGEKVALK